MKKRSRLASLLASAAILLAVAGAALAWYAWNSQAHGDRSWNPRPISPAFSAPGPLVRFDEAHRNAHSLGDRYAPFARLLRADGLDVEPLRSRFDDGALASARVLVVVNAKGPEGDDAGAAFSDDEIAAVERFVAAGGGLLLVADHTPFGAAASRLAERFGVAMHDGEVRDESHVEPGATDPAQLLFDRANGLLGAHPILDGGEDTATRVDRVVTFTGQSLLAPPAATRLLLLSPDATDLPVLSVEMRRSGSGWDRVTTLGDPIPTRGDCQALALLHGRGRVVVAGEAAFLTAQVRGRERFGMNGGHEGNERFARNALRWLAGALPAGPDPRTGTPPTESVSNERSR